jgi:hypothetical protein
MQMQMYKQAADAMHGHERAAALQKQRAYQRSKGAYCAML